jgi:hypothetical protein
MISTCLAAGLTACSSDALPYRNPFDRLVVALGLEWHLGHQPCTRKIVHEGIEMLEFVGTDRCYRFDPPRRMRGVWLVEFEGSEFLPDADRAPDIWAFAEKRIWLEIEDEMLPPEHRAAFYKPAQAFAVEFVGRNASYSGAYGHMGAGTHLVLVDRLLSLRALPPPRRQDLEAYMEDMRRSKKN